MLRSQHTPAPCMLNMTEVRNLGHNLTFGIAMQAGRNAVQSAHPGSFSSLQIQRNTHFGTSPLRRECVERGKKSVAVGTSGHSVEDHDLHKGRLSGTFRCRASPGGAQEVPGFWFRFYVSTQDPYRRLA